MQISGILIPGRVVCGVVASSKKRVLEKLSELVCNGNPDVTPNEAFDCLISRERLGSTGLGHGVAIPHGRLKHQDKAVGAFIRMEEGVDFESIDNQPVDLLFALLVPENSTDEHLNILAQLAEMFSDDEFVERIRNEDSCGNLYHLLTEWLAEK